MSGYTPQQLKRALKKAGLTVVYCDGWDSPSINPFGYSPCDGVVMHHTANSGAAGDHPSLPWMLNNTYAPVRAAHFLVGRSGSIHCTSGSGAYHAGAGGPITLGGVTIPGTQGNARMVGIEIESKGTDPRTDARVDEVDGITPQQVDSAVKLASALLALMGKDYRCAVRHADWTDGNFDRDNRTWLPTRGRKNDTLVPLKFWRNRIRWQMTKTRAANIIGR